MSNIGAILLTIFEKVGATFHPAVARPWEFSVGFGSSSSKNIIYFGDGIYDSKILKNCAFGIAPLNATNSAKKSAPKVEKKAEDKKNEKNLKTVQELDREKLEKKFTKTKKETIN